MNPSIASPHPDSSQSFPRIPAEAANKLECCIVNRAQLQSDPAKTTDSLINAAAAHHRPDTFLQWVIATADRVASGFERDEFDKYNDAKDENEETKTGRNHYQARQLSLFEQIRLDGEPLKITAKDLKWR